jgi:ribonuclease Z
VTLLGTGDPVPRVERFGPATLIEAGGKRLVFDAGRGAATRLWQVGVPLGQVDAVFLTHFHSDHINGLSDLWMTGWLRPVWGRRERPLTLIGPTGTRDIADGMRRAYQHNIDIRLVDEKLPEPAASFDVREFAREGVVYDSDGVKVTAFAMAHDRAGVITPNYGYRVDYAGRSVAISSDAIYDERIIAAAKGVDLLIHEVIAAREELFTRYPELALVRDHHTLPEQVGRIFQQVMPKMAVYTHLVMLSAADVPELPLADLVSQTRRTYQGPLVIGEDLLTFVVGEGVAVYRRGAR